MLSIASKTRAGPIELWLTSIPLNHHLPREIKGIEFGSAEEPDSLEIGG